MLFRDCLIFVVLVAATEAHLDTFERLKQVWQQIETDIQNNSTLLALYNEHIQKHTEARERYMKYSRRSIDHFNCADAPYAPTLTSPTSVHSLRPEHVSVIAALGDSLTAGNGVIGNNIFDCLNEYRGRTWSIGGDFNYEQGVKTLPRLYSVGQCKYDDKACSQLNVAQPGKTSQDMPGQARELVTRLNDSLFGIDMQNEWKVITLFIGGNDLCDYCNDRTTYSPENYHAKIKEALDILHANVPKAFVNLVQIFDITPLAAVSQGIICSLVTNNVCGCAKDKSNAAELSYISAQYQEKIRSLVANNAYDKDDFTVVLQPFFQNTIPPFGADGKYDLAYFAPDCFHFSDIGTNIAAKSLWNNMMEPVGSKSYNWSIANAYHCSQMDGLFRTYRN